MDNITLHKLLEKIAGGDESSFRDLFNSFKQQVYAYAMHFTHSVPASEEIVQDIFLKLWVNKERLAEMNNFEAYLYTITRNLCFDYLKKLAHEHALKVAWSRDAEMSEENTESVFQYHHYESIIQQALDQLPPQQKKIYILSLYQGQKQEEIAESLHISKNTVKVHIAKARAKVRHYLIAHLTGFILLLIIVTCLFFH